MAKINVALYEPEIPQNTGNIARLCACCGADLYLIGKLGFALTDKYTKRAGLDYWDSVNIQKVNSIEELKEQFPDSNFYYLTTKSKKLYTDIQSQLMAGLGKTIGNISLLEFNDNIEYTNDKGITGYKPIVKNVYCLLWQYDDWKLKFISDCR